ncbi:hypothetical protein BB561_003302 [Smittium simulii]|uniref:UV radiation resistance-associated gene protein n=1 Tax=Smittium simulii TaxID=133385 RepID=A0A2T9YM63_9FUNG|nr:hypothetical protein BB561_003302 [Smittium simulii]
MISQKTTHNENELENQTKVQAYDFLLLCSLCTSETNLLFETNKLAKNIENLTFAKKNYDSNQQTIEQLNALKLKIKNLNLKVNAKKTLIEQSLKVINKSKVKLNKKIEFYKNLATKCEQEPTSIGSRRILMFQNKLILDNTVELILKKQADLAQELCFVYQIEEKNNEMTICGLRLNLNSRSILESKLPINVLAQENSAAVGHATYFLFWLAVYTNTQLIYKIRPRSSEPLIYSQVAKKFRVFPLYPTKGIERPRFDYGIQLLFADTYQLQMALGKDEFNSNSILANILTILKALGIYN